MSCILLHGLGQGPASWDGVIGAMGEDAHCLAPDLPGMLRGKEPVYTTLYNELEAYCAQFSEPVDLAGLSLGGILALDYGCRHQEKVRSLVLMGTQFVMPKGLLKVQSVLFHLMPKSAFGEMGFQKSDFIRLTNSMIDLNFERELQTLLCPTLVVCGGRDKANKPASLELAKRIPGAEIAIIEQAGHEVNTDAPGELEKLLRDFYTKHNQ